MGLPVNFEGEEFDEKHVSNNLNYVNMKVLKIVFAISNDLLLAI